MACKNPKLFLIWFLKRKFADSCIGYFKTGLNYRVVSQLTDIQVEPTKTSIIILNTTLRQKMLITNYQEKVGDNKQ
jgi:hypothetical protein